MKTIKILLTIPFLTLTSLLYTQNFWEQQQNNKSIIGVVDTGCPVYNAGDPEVIIDWQYIIDEEGDNDRAMDIDFTPDSNFVFINYHGQYFQSINKEDGSVIWKKSYFIDDTNQFFGQKFITIGNFYYISGWWGGWGAYEITYFGILKTNLNGEKIWLKTIGQDENAQKNVEYFDPIIINVEETNFLVSLHLDNDFKIVKFDSSCNSIWELSDEEMNYDEPLTINLCYDGNDYLIYFRYFVAKIDKNGNIFWALDNIDKEAFWKFTYDNGNYYCTGHNSLTGGFLRKYSLDFNLEMEYISDTIYWQHIISGASSIKVRSDESILIFHDYKYYGNWDEIHTNMNIRHIDKYGNCISTLNLYEYGSQYTTELLLTKEEDYILYGYGYEDFTQESIAVLAKIQPWDVTGVKTLKQPENEADVYPNPFNNKLIIELQKPFTGKLKIYSIDGRIVFQSIINMQNNIRLNTGTIDKGIYLIRLENDKYNISIKLIKQ